MKSLRLECLVLAAAVKEGKAWIGNPSLLNVHLKRKHIELVSSQPQHGSILTPSIPD